MLPRPPGLSRRQGTRSDQTQVLFRVKLIRAPRPDSPKNRLPMILVLLSNAKTTRSSMENSWRNQTDSQIPRYYSWDREYLRSIHTFDGEPRSLYIQAVVKYVINLWVKMNARWKRISKSTIPLVKEDHERFCKLGCVQQTLIWAWYVKITVKERKVYSRSTWAIRQKQTIIKQTIPNKVARNRIQSPESKLN